MGMTGATSVRAARGPGIGTAADVIMTAIGETMIDTTAMIEMTTAIVAAIVRTAAEADVGLVLTPMTAVRDMAAAAEPLDPPVAGGSRGCQCRLTADLIAAVLKAD